MKRVTPERRLELSKRRAEQRARVSSYTHDQYEKLFHYWGQRLRMDPNKPKMSLA
jgi:hypothetical protein